MQKTSVRVAYGRAVAALALGMNLAALSGCGSGQTQTTPVREVTPPLNGNWWITGDMPAIPGNLSSEKFGMAATFDVVDGTIYTSLTDFYPCGNTAVGGGGGIAPAPLNTDRSFTLQTANGNVQSTVQLTVKAVSPATAGQSWSGSFSGTNANPGCTPVQGSFTATPIAPFNGTFSGTGSMGPENTNLQPPDPNLLKQLTVALTLTQGGPASLDAKSTVAFVNSVNSLTGTVSVTGSPCFTTGTTGSVQSGVAGNNFNLTFTMDDGSMLHVMGYAPDPTLGSLILSSATVTGGNCDKWIGLSQTSLTKQ
jgi:hypothetical protein